ncbi:transposase [Streptomyces somaliensis]|uniref:transposase n=1 Tax=Streptomyces somaliensis TaxID=78355 RepID=UPI00359FFAB5
MFPFGTPALVEHHSPLLRPLPGPGQPVQVGSAALDVRPGDDPCAVLPDLIGGRLGLPQLGLNRQGHVAARCTVERLMRKLGITGAVRGQ